MGFIIDSERLHKDVGKVDNIKQMPSQNIKPRPSFCGFVIILWKNFT